MQRFERVGLKIVGIKMVKPSKDHYYGHYETIGQVAPRRGAATLSNVLDLMMDGPVIAMALEGVEAVPVVRKIVGPTEPKAADMGTIRGDYSHISFGYADECNKAIPNLIHASGDSAEAAQEINLWFEEEELMNYSMLHDKFTR